MHLVVLTLALDGGWREPSLVHRILWFGAASGGAFSFFFFYFERQTKTTTTRTTCVTVRGKQGQQ